MSVYERVMEILFECVSEEESGFASEKQSVINSETMLIGEDSNFDSLALISLIVSAEKKLEAEFGVRVSLVGDAALEGDNAKFRTLKTLAESITAQIDASSSKG